MCQAAHQFECTLNVYVSHHVLPCYSVVDASVEDGAACEKNRLEEKQRAARKQRGGDSSWKPRFERNRLHFDCCCLLSSSLSSLFKKLSHKVAGSRGIMTYLSKQFAACHHTHNGVT